MASEHHRHGRRSAEQRYMGFDQSHVAEPARSATQRPPIGGIFSPEPSSSCRRGHILRHRRPSPALPVTKKQEDQRGNERDQRPERILQALGKVD
jgi:hypothetical protein